MSPRIPLLALLAALVAAPAAAAPVRDGPASAELIAETTQLAPGETRWVGLLLSPDHGWHVYWRNPGDSGLATNLEWQLPEGVSAGPIQWPYPHPEKLGELTNYGYAEATLHPVAITLPADFSASEITLNVIANWLTCKDICIPGLADLSLTLPVAPGPAKPGPWAPEFELTRRSLPQTAGWPAHFQLSDTAFQLRLEPPAGQLDRAAKLEFYPYSNSLVSHSAEQTLRWEDGALILTQTISPYLEDAPERIAGVLVASGSGPARAFELSADAGTFSLPTHASSAPDEAAPGFWLALILALLGGLLLNLMPCVFPILSLKAITLVGANDAAGRRRDAFAYTAGVVLSCLVAAGLLLGLRAAGGQLGWGFQLQSPVFVALLAYLLFALGLSLSGAVQFGTRWMATGDALTRRSGATGSFFTGVLAVIVASPCTAPFMGAALGFAVTQSAPLALAVFAALGLGLAAPFLLIGLFPALARLLPRPGAWMETFKQAMAFPLYLTAVWLLWILSRQAGPDLLAAVLAGLVLIAFALWLQRSTGWLSRGLRIAALAAAIALPLTVTTAPPPTAAALNAETWSAQRVSTHLAAGRTVFVNFTADWCLSCKFNERGALSSDRVREAFAAPDRVYLKADWTLSNAAITAELARHGRNGVPLYLVLRPGEPPQILPQFLSPDIILNALEGKESS